MSNVQICNINKNCGSYLGENIIHGGRKNTDSMYLLLMSNLVLLLLIATYCETWVSTNVTSWEISLQVIFKLLLKSKPKIL